MRLYLDSSAARGVLARRGVGRLRHLSCRILWLQDLVMEKRLLVRSVMGALNPADNCHEKIQRSKARIIEAAGLQPRTNQPFVQRLERADPAPRLFRCHGRSDASDGFQRRVLFTWLLGWLATSIWPFAWTTFEKF